ncbi:N-acetyltransferase [Streptomyces ruber]|uniref:N-acetyltransferase n=2 Tax=Streptomyces TaxID=1883 RepID=A0A918BJ75_9ACTN|nr:GNAT family N-acetyltransferase [Streptomyces ruber]GGQ67605.1 N-acetyltransferase [Streptomyces ruber]
MATEQHRARTATLRIGGEDDELERRLGDELDAFNSRVTGAGNWEDFSVRLTDAHGRLAGGLTGSVWGTLCTVEMLWIREDLRGAGWGSRVLKAAEQEAVRRGCTDMTLSSYTFQAPDFYRKHGYRETGRSEGVPGRHCDVYFHKSLTAP